MVSGAPEFFKRAFGANQEEFHDLLLWPHKFTFNRDWYEKSDGKPEFDEFKAKFSRIPDSERAELLWLLSSSDPRNFKDLPSKTKSKQLRETLNFYIPLAKEKEEETISAEKVQLEGPKVVGTVDLDKPKKEKKKAEEPVAEVVTPEVTPPPVVEEKGKVSAQLPSLRPSSLPQRSQADRRR